MASAEGRVDLDLAPSLRAGTEDGEQLSLAVCPEKRAGAKIRHFGLFLQLQTEGKHVLNLADGGFQLDADFSKTFGVCSASGWPVYLEFAVRLVRPVC